MDENNRIIKFVSEGMKLEREGKIKRAQELFTKAWKTSSDNHEKCIAAHFVARHQNSPEDTLKWNMESLSQANGASQKKLKVIIRLSISTWELHTRASATTRKLKNIMIWLLKKFLICQPIKIMNPIVRVCENLFWKEGIG